MPGPKPDGCFRCRTASQLQLDPQANAVQIQRLKAYHESGHLWEKLAPTPTEPLLTESWSDQAGDVSGAG